MPATRSVVNRPLVISEEPVGKYEPIIWRLDVEYRHVKYSRLILRLLSPRGFGAPRVYFHVRYIKWRGWLRTIPVYLALVGLCRLRSIRIVWTCHNIWEHSFPAQWPNTLLRRLLTRAAYRVVVLHEALVPHLPVAGRDKTVVAHFGSFRDSVERAAVDAERNPEFMSRYREWKSRNDIDSPDVVMISTILDADDLLAFLDRNPDITGLVVAPRLAPRETRRNVLLYTDPVYAEIDGILQGNEIIGYVGLENLSVPTSIYMFCGYGIPIIGKAASPVQEILEEQGVGESYRDLSQMREAYDRIRADYPAYAGRCRQLSERHTWAASAEIHSHVFT